MIILIQIGIHFVPIFLSLPGDEAVFDPREGALHDGFTVVLLRWIITICVERHGKIPKRLVLDDQRNLIQLNGWSFFSLFPSIREK